MATQLAPRADNPIAMFQAQLESRAKEIQSALPQHITPDKFQRTVMTAVAQNPDLLKADRQSLILACYKAAQDALLPDGREAALVTFNTRQKVDGQWQSVKQVQYMPMVYGLRKKILQSGDVVSLEVSVVYRAEVEKGTFLYEVGLEPPLRHRPSLDLTEEETSDEQIVAAYSIATMKDGTKSYEIMRRFEINKVRAVSQTGATSRTDRQGNPIQPKGPWVDWFAEMAKKTVMRRHAKTLPMSGDILLDIEGRELEAGMSTARALGSTAPDAPQIEDRTDETPHDPETGEITQDEQDTEEESGTAREAPGAEESTSAESDTVGTSTEGPAADSPPVQAQPEPEPQVATDEPHHPGTAIADKIIAEINEAGAILDISTIMNRSALDMQAMLDEDAVRVEVAADKRRQAIRAERAKAPKEVA
jgi:recombination protein RecT